MTFIKLFPCIAIVSTLLFTVAPAEAAPITGRIVKTWIEDAKAFDQKTIEKQPYNVGKLHGYLSGLADAMAQTRAFCPPIGLPHKELLTIVEKYLEHDYANRDRPATPRIMQLFRQTYPCRTGNKMPSPKKEQDT
ncbi:MAG: Rap1a/Tai family immunity protein [Gallionella sp.]|nr:Rap1a/Tai family immunity protein [Gallionella sp.]